ncbi:MAG: hypothetical protein ACLTAV_05595 [Finegoldia magna]
MRDDIANTIYIFLKILKEYHCEIRIKNNELLFIDTKTNETYKTDNKNLKEIYKMF